MKNADPESGDEDDDEGDSDWEPDEAGPHLWEHGLIESYNKKGGEKRRKER